MADKTRYTANLVSNSNLYVDISVDRVGIGTTIPTSKLTVSGNALITGIVTASTGTLISGIGVSNNGVSVGTTITTINFTGSGISSVTYDSGVATVTIPSTTKEIDTYTATEGQTEFLATYSVGYVDVYLNGVKLSETQYTATNGTSIILNEGASLNDVVEIVGLNNINIVNVTIISPFLLMGA
jgi:hypothetical protein